MIYLFAAYTVFWVGIFFYLLHLHSKLKRCEERVRD